MLYKISKNITILCAAALISLLLFSACTGNDNRNILKLKKGSRVLLLGGNLGSRMLHYDHFETEMHLRNRDSMLFFRNMCDPGSTPGFRPNAGRQSPWAFPGAEKFQTELANNSDTQGFFETDDQWLTRLKADIIITFFGYSESFAGEAGLENYKAELDSFIKYTLKQKYNGVSPPQLAIVSPIAFEDLSDEYDLPNGKKENERLLRYTKAMKEVSERNNVLFVDAFRASQKWYREKEENLTIDGFQLTNDGYVSLSKFLADKIFGGMEPESETNRGLVKSAVQEKNWMWHNDYKMPNGVHAYGQRYQPFGPENYPAEIKKIREMTAIRDEAIWKAIRGEKTDLASADATTSKLPEVKTNYAAGGKNGTREYLYGKNAIDKFRLPPGYKVELFASEQGFPDLAKPAQMSFDNKGRLWVSTLPSYPHWRPGDPKPNDKLLILEDTNGDSKADRTIVFADSLHLPVGFEFGVDGVFVAQGEDLILLKDTDGNDKADVKEIVLSGFDDHDTHHGIHAFIADPSGAIYMGEGLFLHSAVETPYGTARGTWGGFFRYDPRRHHLERSVNVSIPNPWGIAFDEWGQDFYLETSEPDVRWMMPSSIKPIYGAFTFKSDALIEIAHRVRPSSGLEFVSSRHFPEIVQGDMLFNNTIGFLGTKQHIFKENGTGYKTKHRQDLLVSEDRNFRPVDLEFAPDGSLYIVDWHNTLIGHMQHSARDPLRDHQHGRIYRITCPDRPLVQPAKVYGATIEQLLNNLKLPEYRTRYRTRRELRGRYKTNVLYQLQTWIRNLDAGDPAYEHHLVEALWVSWGFNNVDEKLLSQLLTCKTYQARAAAVRVLRYSGHQVGNQADLLMAAARDEHGRVRLEAIVSASWLDKLSGMRILNEAAKKPLDSWMEKAHATAVAHLSGKKLRETNTETPSADFKGKELEQYYIGKAIYAREGYCTTCHQADGQGLQASGFPPLAGTKWVTGSEERIIKVVLNGLHGPLEVNGKTFTGDVPMTPFGAILKDDEIAAVVTYVRNSFGNKASVVTPARVKQIREATKDKKGFYATEEILKANPL